MSEFHTLIRNIITHSLDQKNHNSIEVKISSQNTPTIDDYNSNDIIIFITSVKPLYEPLTSENPYSLNQVKNFQYSVPFTLDTNRTHAKTMNTQWKRNIILSVEDYFPYIQNRQIIITKHIIELCPIKVAIEDIQDRIDAIKFELNDYSIPVLNNLMRIAQGSVMPQVNAGAAEVAKVFLSENNSHLNNNSEQTSSTNTTEIPSTINNDNKNDERLLKIELQATLYEFLILSKTVLARCRELMKLNEINNNNYSSSSSLSLTARDSTMNMSITDTQNLNWQLEMEKGYKKLVDSIIPYIKDIDMTSKTDDVYYHE